MKSHPSIISMFVIGLSCCLVVSVAIAKQDSKQNLAMSKKSPQLTEGKSNFPNDWSENSLRVGDKDRWYRVFASENYRMGNPAVVLLHGGTQSMRKIFDRKNDATGHWETLAGREGFLLIVPNGTNVQTGDTKGDRQNWNDLRPTDKVANPDSDDVLFIEQLVGSLEKEFRFDSTRVYLTGASNGGMMTMRMLIEKPQLFAAGVSFIASLPEDYSSIKRPETPTPFLMCNGTKDPLVKWNGGQVARNRGVTTAVETTVRWWAETNGCKSSPESVTLLDDRDPKDGCRVERHVYTPRKSGTTFEFIKIEGGGHTLPSVQYSLPDNRIVKRLIGTMCHDVEGAELAWEFMKSHQRPGQSKE